MSTALALRLTGNRLGQVAAPAAAGLVAGAAGVAAPFVMLGGLLLLSSGIALRSPAKQGPGQGQGPGRDRGWGTGRDRGWGTGMGTGARAGTAGAEGPGCP